MENTVTDKKEIQSAEFVNLAVGKRSLNFSGEDIFYKLAKNESRPVAIESAPVYFVGADGRTYDTKRYKVGIRNNQLAGIMSKRYTFISNEKAYQLITDAGFKPERTDFSKNGNAMFVQVFSDEAKGLAPHTFTNDGNGDRVDVGLMIRNSIDGTTAFGGDIFTYRSRCSNGAVLGKKSLGSFSVKHVGQYERLVAVFRSQLNRAFDLSMKVKAYYQKAAEVKINMEMAETLIKTKLPQKFLPDFINVVKERNNPQKIILERKDASVWEGFNAITEKAWHQDVGITTKKQYTERANSWLINVVEPLMVAA